MNDELQKALSDILAATLNSAGEAKEFLLAEMPEAVQQLLVWKLAYYSVWMVISLVAFVCAALVVRKLLYFTSHKNTKVIAEKAAARSAREAGEPWASYSGSGRVTSLRYDEIMGKSEDHEGEVVACCIGCVVLVVLGIAAMNLTWLQIWLAPKVYLIEYAADLAR